VTTNVYFEALDLADQVRAHMFDAVGAELARAKYAGLTPAQALLIYTLGDEELKISELYKRGCYRGQNVSYNLNKLVHLGLLARRRNPNDKRSCYVRATNKGRAIAMLLRQAFDRRFGNLVASGTALAEQMASAKSALRALDNCLTAQIVG